MDLHERVAKLEQDKKSVHRRLDEGEEKIAKDHDTLLECKQEHVEFERRLDNMEKLTEGIHQMVSEVKGMREDLSEVKGQVKDVSQRLDENERRPVEKIEKRWEIVIAAAITSVVSVIVGAVVGFILNGIS